MLLPLLGACVDQEKYDRSEWGDWQSKGKCTMREMIIRDTGSQVAVDEECRAVRGSWYSVYDGKMITNANELEIDHIVPVKEAWESGGKNWSRKQKNAFYNDRSNLIAVSRDSNRAKSDRDPATWQPSNKTYTCNFIMNWVRIKNRYGLTVDPQERTAIKNFQCKGVS